MVTDLRPPVITGREPPRRRAETARAAQPVAATLERGPRRPPGGRPRRWVSVPSGERSFSRPAQLQDGLGVDLAHAALGHPEDLADLRQRETFVVVQRQHRPLALAELHDGLGQDLLGLLVLEQRHRAGRGVGDGVAERGPLGAVAADHEDLVERGHADEGDLAQDVLELGFRHARARRPPRRRSGCAAGWPRARRRPARRRGPWPGPSAAPSRWPAARR